MIRTFCDYCGEQCSTEHFIVSYKNSLDDYFAPIDTKEICHDCFWKVQGFIKGMNIPDIPTSPPPDPSPIEGTDRWRKGRKWWWQNDSAQLDWEDQHGKR